jgi:hypothetical protein
MAIYKTRWFARWARKEGLSDTALRRAIDEMTKGLYEADLGGDLLKKRIARPGEGKRGVSGLGRHQSWQPLDFCLWFCQERAQQHRCG